MPNPDLVCWIADNVTTAVNATVATNTTVFDDEGPPPLFCWVIGAIVLTVFAMAFQTEVRIPG